MVHTLIACRANVGELTDPNDPNAMNTQLDGICSYYSTLLDTPIYVLLYCHQYLFVISCCCSLNIYVSDIQKEYQSKPCIYIPGAGSPWAICLFMYCYHIAVAIPSCIMSSSLTPTSAHSASLTSFPTLPPIGSFPSPSPSPSHPHPPHQLCGDK